MIIFPILNNFDNLAIIYPIFIIENLEYFIKDEKRFFIFYIFIEKYGQQENDIKNKCNFSFLI